MAITTFDTNKFVRRLEAAGMTRELAEVQAEVLTEAFNVNLEALVTKDYLEAQLTARFAEQDARMEARFAEQDARIDVRFAEQDARLAQLEARLEGKIDSNHRVFVWTQAIVVAGVLLPYFERLLAL